jgi:hypothetical protein
MLDKYNAHIRAKELAKLIYEIRKDGLQITTNSNGSIAVINTAWKYRTNNEVRDEDGNILPYYAEINVGYCVPLPHTINSCIVLSESLLDDEIYAKDLNTTVIHDKKNKCVKKETTKIPKNSIWKEDV